MLDQKIMTLLINTKEITSSIIVMIASYSALNIYFHVLL